MFMANCARKMLHPYPYSSTCLQCRDDWVSSLVDELDDSDSYEYVKHLTDIYRIHLFDAVMQYRAIFFDGSSTSASAATARAGAGAAGAQGSVAGAGGAGVQDAAALAMSVKESSMLHSWVQHRLSLYLDALRTHLPNITEGGNLSSVLEHCMVSMPVQACVLSEVILISGCGTHAQPAHTRCLCCICE
jgi:hypothetical protein